MKFTTKVTLRHNDKTIVSDQAELPMTNDEECLIALRTLGQLSEALETMSSLSFLRITVKEEQVYFHPDNISHVTIGTEYSDKEQDLVKEMTERTVSW